MTNFYAVYLFIIISIVFLGLGLYFKRGWLFILGSLGWLFSSFYCFTTATPTTQYIYLFGVFCLAAAIANIIASVTINRQPKAPPPAEVSNSDQILANAERVRNLRGKHKLQNQKGIF
jgi:hypothetical protein